jgi:hypothetical protein
VGREVRLPVRLDPPVLLDRLGAALSGDALAEAFAALLICDEDSGDGALAPLLGALDRPIVERWLGRRIAEGGAAQLFVQWLNATSDLRRLCELCCVEPRGPRMDPEVFLDALSLAWIGFPGSLRRRYMAFGKNPGEPHMLKLLVSTMPGRNLRPEFDPEEILGALRETLHEKAADFAERLTEERDHYEQRVAELERRYDEIVACHGPFEMRRELMVMRSAQDLEPELRDKLLPALAATFQLMWSLRNAMLPLEVARGDVVATRQAVVRLHQQRGPILTESAWTWILAEQDVRLLHLLIAVAMQGDNSPPEWATVRWAMAENRALCAAICDAAQRLPERQD